MTKENTMKKSHLTLIIVALALFVPAICIAAAVAELKDIPLVWKPTDPVSTYGAIDMTVYKNARFVIMPFGDARKRPSEIGQNTEKKFAGKDMLVTTKDSVPDWLTDKIAKTLADFDVTVVKADGTVILEADIVKFFVTEASMYKAEVSLKVRLKSKTNAVVWEGMTTGSASRFGSSYKAENYHEALSNATISAVHGLLKNDAFIEAVQKTR
jgi:hypothetical protein